MFIYDEKYQGWGFYDYQKWGVMLRFISENENINDCKFEKSLLLMIEYIKRVPELYNSFVHHIKTNRFSSNKKFQIYFLLLLNNKDDLIYKSLFLQFSNSFLNSLGRGESEKYRINTWETLFYYFQFEKDKVEEILIKYLQIPNNYFVEVLNNDLDVLLKFIDSNYTPTDFRITYWLNVYFEKLNQYNGIDKDKYQQIENKYYTKAYKFYILLNWNRLNGQNRNKYKKELDFEAYNKTKKAEISKSVSVNNSEDFIPVIEAIKNGYLINPDNCGIEVSIRIILSDILEKNLSLGMQLTLRIIKEFPRIKYIAHLPVFLIKTKKDIDFINEYLENLDGEHYIEAKFHFLYTIPIEFIRKKYAEEFLKLFELSPLISLQGAERYLKVAPYIYDSILNIIVSKNEEGNSIKIDDLDLEKYINHITNISNLITFYFQQKEIDPNFDDTSKIFLHIFLLKEQFLIDYIEFLNRKGKLHDKLFHSEDLAKIWDHEKIEELMDSLFVIYKNDKEANRQTILETKHYRLNRELFRPLFSMLNDSQKNKALSYLMLKVKDHNNSIVMVNLILFISRQMGNDVFKRILHKYLEFHTDLALFTKLELQSNSTSLYGTGTTGDIYANRWTNILEILEEFPNKLATIPLTVCVKNMIETHLNQADEERECEYKGYR